MCVFKNKKNIILASRKFAVFKNRKRANCNGKIIVLQNRKSVCSARKNFSKKVVDKSKKLRYNKGEPKETLARQKIAY